MIKRVCFLGTPRCGSQYIADITHTSMKNATGCEIANLYEPFVHTMVPYVNIITPHDRVNYIMSTIKHYEFSILRYFPTDNMSSYIVDELDKLGFTFINITRSNIEHQLLSYMVALITNEWQSKELIARTNKITIPESRFSDAIWLHDIIKAQQSTLNKFNIVYSSVNYETASRDLEDIIGIQIISSTTYQKQASANPYDIIENADEVKTYLQSLINPPQ